MRSLRPPSAPTRRRVVRPCTGRGHHPLDPSSRGGEAPREPGRGPRDGDRAPPRGVDVKQPLSAGSPGRPGPWEGPGGPSGGPRTPKRGPRPARAPGRTRDPDPTPRARGVLHQPLAPGPCPRPGRGSQPSPRVPPGEAFFPPRRGIPRKGPFWPFFDPQPQEPEKAGTGPRREGLM